MYLLGSLIMQNFKEILRVGPDVWGHAISRLKMAHFPQVRTFSEKTVNIIFMCLLIPFAVQIWIKSLQQIQSYENTTFLGLK